MTITLLPHQARAVDWLLENERGILADVPGLGKTFPAIEAAFALPGPRLFIVPSYLRSNWRRDILALHPEAEVVTLGSEKAGRVYKIRRGAAADALVASYEQLRMETATFPKLGWNVIVFDEAHKLRGRGGYRVYVAADGTKTRIRKSVSLQADAANRIVDRARFVFLLTGTPMVKNVGDLYGQLRLLDDNSFTSYWNFVKRWGIIVHTPWAEKIVGLKDPTGLREMLGKYVLRRDYPDVGIEMPETLHKDIYVDVDPRWRQAYIRVRNTHRSIDEETGEIRYLLTGGALMSELYGFTSGNADKLAALRDLLADYQSEQVIIWVWRRNTARLLHAILCGKLSGPVGDEASTEGDVGREEGLGASSSEAAWLVTGEVTQEERQGRVELFRRSTGGRLVATIASLSLGENIQTASTCIFYEESYVAADNEQAIARLRRLGQKKPVTAFHLLIDRTVDVAVHKVQAQRGEDAEQALAREVWSYD